MPAVLLQLIYPVLLLPYMIVDGLFIDLAQTEVIAVGEDWK